MHAVWSLAPFTHVPHTWARACTRTLRARRHTDVPVGCGGGARYYQLIFAVLFLLQRVRPYVSLSATAFNLLLASAVQTSNLHCWFDSKRTGRLGAEYIAYDVYKACHLCRSRWNIFLFLFFKPPGVWDECDTVTCKNNHLFFRNWFFHSSRRRLYEATIRDRASSFS